MGTLLMLSVQMALILSRQEPVKRLPRNKTLHEWMCFEAEDVIKNNWTDVAVHDRKLLGKMRPGDTRLWVIHEFGSLFLPCYCKLYEKRKQEEQEYVFSSLEINMMRLIRADDLGSIQSRIMRKSARFYFVTKGFGDYDGLITPSDFRSVANLVFRNKISPCID